MASSKDYLLYILELLREINGISYKKMMGEFILYKDDIIFGGIYDNRFLIKETKSTSRLNLKKQTPYPGGRDMLLVDTEDSDEINDLVIMVCNDLRKGS